MISAKWVCFKFRYLQSFVIRRYGICETELGFEESIGDMIPLLRTTTKTNLDEKTLRLVFMSPCIVRIFQYISNKIQRYTVYLYLETVLHVSGGTSTHYQERIQLYLQHLVFVTPLLLSAARAADSSNVRHPQHTQTGWFQLFHDSGR
jgi:hypothetical protein